MVKVPYMLVVGDKEVVNNELAVRSYKTKEQVVMPRADFIDQLLTEIKERKL
jgi:threonyl-tRNA synthetase